MLFFCRIKNFLLLKCKHLLFKCLLTILYLTRRLCISSFLFYKTKVNYQQKIETIKVLKFILNYISMYKKFTLKKTKQLTTQQKVNFVNETIIITLHFCLFNYIIIQCFLQLNQ